MNPTLARWLPTLIFVPLVGFALYPRVRRTFGRQPFTPKRMIARIVLLVAISALFLAWTPTPSGCVAAAIGALLGGILAIYGLKHTRYDLTSADKGYTSNPWIGLVVTALFLGRFVARMFSVYEASPLDPSAAPGAGLQRSPLTLGTFFLMATYYIAYYAGVLLKVRGPAAVGPPPG